MIARIASIMLVAVTGLSYLGYRQLRTTSAAPTTPPAPITGTVAYQPVDIREQRAIELLAAIGNTQPTSDIVSEVVSWSLAEDGSSDAIDRNNLWNTTMCGYNMVGSINADGACGVGHYATPADGIAANAATLAQSNFADVRNALLANDVDGFKTALWSSQWAASRYNYGADWPTYHIASVSTMVVSGGKADPIPNWQQHINAGFYATNCGAWGMQSGCQHFGTDIGGSGEGTPVYAPFGGVYTGCQDNGDSGPYIGKWIEYTVDDGARFLINHFRDSPFCGAAVGTRINAGDFIGTMREDANHIHVQVIVNGGLVDFEQYWEMH